MTIPGLIRRLVVNRPLTAADHDANLTAIETAFDGKADALATQTALNLKANASAISNVNNTSDLSKPVSTAQQAALDAKATAGPIGSSGVTMTAGILGQVGTGAPQVYGLGSGLSIVNGVLTVAASDSGTVTSVGLSVPTGLAVTPASITAAGTFVITLAAGYGIPTTARQSEWDTAYAERGRWAGGATGLNAATGRASLELGTAATAASGDFAPAAQGVTNGNSHNHDGGDGAQIAYGSLSGLPTLFDPASPGAIGGNTASAGSFTALAASGSLLLPGAAAGTPVAGHIYRITDQLRYRDSTVTEQVVLHGGGNLANLANAATARTNLGLTATATATPAGGLAVQGGNLVMTEGIALTISNNGEIAVVRNNYEEKAVDRACSVVGVTFELNPTTVSTSGSSRVMLYARRSGTKTSLLTTNASLPVTTGIYANVTADLTGNLTLAAGDSVGVDLIAVGTGATGLKLTVYVRYS